MVRTKIKGAGKERAATREKGEVFGALSRPSYERLITKVAYLQKWKPTQHKTEGLRI